jgi:hypothetical protein
MSNGHHRCILHLILRIVDGWLAPFWASSGRTTTSTSPTHRSGMHLIILLDP